MSLPLWASAPYIFPILSSEHLSCLPLCSLSLTSFYCLFPSLAPAAHSFGLFFSSLLCVDTSFLVFLSFLALSCPPVPTFPRACRRTKPSLLVLSQVPVTCCCEVSAGCLASVQGFVSSPCPSLHLLAQASAATLGLAAGGCLAVKWVVCERVGIPFVPCSLALGLGLGVECCCLGS